MSTAIVLSGGGTKGAFEVGVVRLLYERGIRPDILCGTSIGAINALKLAEGESSDDPSRGCAGLPQVWSDLQEARDMYVEQPWLHHDKLDGDIRRALTGKSGLSLAGPGTFPGTEALDAFADVPVWGLSHLFEFASGVLNMIPGLSWLATDGKDLLESLQVIATEADSLYNLGPVARKLREEIDQQAVRQWGEAGGKLRLGHVGLFSGELRWVTETGAVVARDGRTPVMKTVTPKGCAHLENQIGKLQAKWESQRRRLLDGVSGSDRQQVQDSLAALSQEQADVFRELQECRERLADQPASKQVPVRVSLTGAAQASATIPAMFGPVSLDGERAVDGGVREGLPLQMAVDLGADTIYAVRVTGRVGPSRFEPMLASTAARSVELLLDEVNEGDTIAVRDGSGGVVLHPERPTGGGTTKGAQSLRARPPGLSVPAGVEAVLIEPDDLLYGTKVLDPGLLKINMDYGYMRAADVLDGVVPEEPRWRSSTAIALHRRDTWVLENRRHGRPDPRIPAHVDTSPDNHRIHPALDAFMAVRHLLGTHMVPAAIGLGDDEESWAVLQEALDSAGELEAARAIYPIPPLPDPALQAQIDERKRELAEMITERRALEGPMPDDIDVWTESLELHPWAPEPDGRDDAAFVSVSVPTSIRVNDDTRAKVTVRNTGASVWEPKRVRLTNAGGFLSDEIVTWGVFVVPLDERVPPGETHTFDFTIKSSIPGRHPFRWRMSTRGTGFGPESPSRTILVTGGSSSQESICAELRKRLAEAERTLELNQDLLDGGVGGKGGKLTQMIKAQQRKVASLKSEMRSRGCG